MLRVVICVLQGGSGNRGSDYFYFLPYVGNQKYEAALLPPSVMPVGAELSFPILDGGRTKGGYQVTNSICSICVLSNIPTWQP